MIQYLNSKFHIFLIYSQFKRQSKRRKNTSKLTHYCKIKLKELWNFLTNNTRNRLWSIRLWSRRHLFAITMPYWCFVRANKCSLSTVMNSKRSRPSVWLNDSKDLPNSLEIMNSSSMMKTMLSLSSPVMPNSGSTPLILE